MKINLLGARVDGLNMTGVVEKIAGFINDKKPHRVITLNPEILFYAQQKPTLMEIINQAHLVTADGVGILWAAKMAGTPLPARVTGIDLIWCLSQKAASVGWRIFFLGASPGVAEEAANQLQKHYPSLKIAGTAHGYFQALEEPKIVAKIRQAQPDILFVALGAPKQEIFIARYLQALNVPVCIGVGGSFDVIAGRVKRMPVWVQKIHLEWLGRLIQAPKRWRRALVLPRFIWLVIKTYNLPFTLKF